jgi:hypothetical protein
MRIVVYPFKFKVGWHVWHKETDEMRERIMDDNVEVSNNLLKM